MLQADTLEKPSLLSRPAFWPVALVILILGNALDLLGTYIGQPHFENEANSVHKVLLAHGMELGWPGAILGKGLYCLVGAWALRLFLTQRRAYYPAHAATLREFFTQFLYGRALSWAETLYRLPRLRPTLLFIGAAIGLTGPYFAYLGYENLAAIYGLWAAPWFRVGIFDVDWFLIVFVITLFVWLCWLLWADYRSARAEKI